MNLARLQALGLALLLALVAWIYAPTLGHGLVWDDWTVVAGTRAQRGLDWAGLRWAGTAFVAGHYHPLTWLSFAVDDRLGGGAPWSYHFTSALWHALSALLVARVSWRLLGRLAECVPDGSPSLRALASLWSAAFFAVHPLRVESVAWATERRDVLSACLLLAALLAYLRRLEAPRARRWMWLSVAATFHALALLAKAQVAFPLVLLVLDVYPLRRHRQQGRLTWSTVRGLLLEKLLFALPCVPIGLLALRAQAAAGALTSVAEHGFAERLAQAAYGLVFYVRATWLSLRFAPLYERPVPLDPAEPRFALAIALATLGAVALFALRRRAPALVAATLTYMALLFPVLGLFQSGVQLVADRYSYLSCLGFTLLAAAGWARLVARAGTCLARIGLSLAPLVLTVGWATLARDQTQVWRDDETLWKAVLEMGPSAVADNNLGQMLAARGDVVGALAHLQRALVTVPSYARPWSALLALLQQRPESIPPADAARLAEVLLTAIRHHPRSVLAARVLARALERAGNEAAARTWDAEARKRATLAPTRSRERP